MTRRLMPLGTKLTRTLASTAALATALLLLTAPASAGWRQRPAEGDSVTAESRYGNGAISAPVRTARGGYEVRLPGGNWVGCRTSCAETLRVETVDLFETDGRMTGYGTMAAECGVFGCLDWSRR